MKKTSKRIISLALCVIMLFSVSVAAFAENTPPDKEKYNYVSLGASNASGYGLHGFVPEELYQDPQALYRKGDSDDPAQNAPAVAKDGYFTSGYYFYSDRCYPALIQQELQQRLGDDYEVVLNQCAQNSMRVDDLRFLIDDSYPPDAYNAWRLGNGEIGSGWMYDLERARDMTVNGRRFQKEQTDLRAEYKEALSTADFITFDLGINNFGVYLMFRLVGGMENPSYSADFADILGEQNTAAFYAIRDKLRSTIMGLIPDAESILDTVEFYADTLAYAYMGFIVNFDKCMEFIYENNPDVDMVVVSVQNMMAGLKVDLGGITIPLGDIFGAAVDLANSYTAVLSPYHDKYTYADVRENGHVEYFCDAIKEYDGNPANIDQDILDCFDAYEGDLQLQCSIREMTKDCPDKYEAAYQAASHVYARYFQRGAEIDVLDLGGGLSLDDSAISAALIALINDSAQKMINGADLAATLASIDEQLDAMFDTPAERSSACLYTLMLYAQCFFVHPTATGCEELKTAILDAYDNGKDGTMFVENVVESLPEKVANIIINSVTDFIDSIFDRIGLNALFEKLLNIFEKIELAYSSVVSFGR